jgi:hypothetical protein
MSLVYCRRFRSCFVYNQFSSEPSLGKMRDFLVDAIIMYNTICSANKNIIVLFSYDSEIYDSIHNHNQLVPL